MGCQTKIAQAVIDRGADYLLALKDNQRSLADEVETFFETPTERRGEAFETIDADHGRIETRRHGLSYDVDWLTTERRFPGEPRFPGLRAIAMVEATVERDGTTTTARRFFLSSLAMDARMLARAVRAHWGIENRLHWVLDVVFHDDLMRLRTAAWTEKHGHHQAHGDEPHPRRPRQGQPQGQTQNRSLGPKLPSRPHHQNSSVTFKRFPCASRATAAIDVRIADVQRGGTFATRYFVTVQFIPQAKTIVANNKSAVLS